MIMMKMVTMTSATLIIMMMITMINRMMMIKVIHNEL